MKKSPLILIAPGTQQRGVEFADHSLSLSQKYSLAITAAGGLPWVLPVLPDAALVAEAVRRCDGVLLTGGDDVQTELYAPDLPPAVKKTVSAPEPERDWFELVLIDEIFRQRRPLLAICRGHQILNVALGGTLVADIPSQLPGSLRHARPDRKNEVVHDVELTPGSRLATITGKTRLGVNSSHHQAVGRVAGLLQVTAVSADGVIEGMELKPGVVRAPPFLIAVQYHPERLYDRHREHLKLFSGFVRACGRGSK